MSNGTPVSTTYEVLDLSRDVLATGSDRAIVAKHALQNNRKRRFLMMCWFTNSEGHTQLAWCRRVERDRMKSLAVGAKS